MLPESAAESRALVIQQARLGDLVQSLPAIEAVQARYPERPLDLLCSAPLGPVLARSQAIRRIIPWDGAQWRAWADQWTQDPAATLRTVQTFLASLGEIEYDRVYNLNQHARGILMAHLFTSHSVEADQTRQADSGVSPWTVYLQQVAKERGENRVHLADAWCGLCGVRPRGRAPILDLEGVALPEDLAAIGEQKGLWVALVTGAGDSARCVSPSVWASWIRAFLTQVDDGQVVLIGSGQEREAGQAMLEATPTLLQGRIWDTTGRTTLPQLMTLLARCRWVVGADTGPLHLATTLGSRALGFYFARARVHETGPYGKGHWVYQYPTQAQPDSWPINESIELICGGRRRAAPGWSLWKSHLDQWGVFFDDGTAPQALDLQRATIWQSLSPTLYESAAA
jgi:ADP-heptose:LPS heptosyltransferase